jgi:DNA polymerase (family 10)
VENAEVARLLRETADLLDLSAANPFRVRAYRNAARVVEELPRPAALVPESELDALPGIGADLAGKIHEAATTGRLAALAALERRIPAGLVALLQVQGLGPKRVRELHRRLRIRTLEDLSAAIASGRVRRLKGFGARSEEKLRRALAARPVGAPRMLRAVAAEYGESLLTYLRRVRGVERAELAGSFRRCRETVGDLDILVIAADAARVVGRFTAYPGAAEVLAAGPTRAAIRLRSGLQVDLRVLDDASYGAGLYYFTGSKAHNVAVRRRAQEMGLKVNEYGVWRRERRIAGRTEAEVARTVGLPLIPPELREDQGEIEAALAGTLPKLVRREDLRGDLQMHTTASDGRDSLEAMADAARALGYAYMAVTDHSPAVRVTGGLDRAGFRRQWRRIERLNAGYRGFTILKGAEVDILADGSLDLDDDTLAEFDIVLVSLHSRLDLPAREQTRRVLKALRHPSVDVLAHPTGRLVGRRPPAAFDLREVVRAAVDYGVVLEVNAQPERLDLDDTACRLATELGATFTISTDAHSAADLGLMRWGVDQARRGWLSAGQVANTRPLASLRRLLHAAR